LNPLDYLRDHPNRRSRINDSEAFFEASGLNPIYVDIKFKLIDVSSLCSFIRVHEGAGYKNEFKSMLSYLRSSMPRDPEDDAPDLYEIQYQDYIMNEVGEKPECKFPFFVKPITAYAFCRWHLRNSPQLYGLPLEYSSPLFNGPARDLIMSAMLDLREKNRVAYEFLLHDAELICYCTRTERAMSPYKYELSVSIKVGDFRITEKVEVDEKFFPATAEKILKFDDVLKHLPFMGKAGNETTL
jgi:hypothetical protein